MGEVAAVAFSIKVQGIPRDDGTAIWSMDGIDWWKARALIADPRFRQTDNGSGYVDYVAILTLSEANDLADSFTTTAFSAKATRLERNLSRRAPESCWIVVIIYEWESGM